jgi:hypothetical protein
MTTQPEALRLADFLDSEDHMINSKHIVEAAAELRRLHDLNQKLLETLEWIAEHNLRRADLTVCGHIAHGLIGGDRAAIAKARGEK